MHVIPAVEIQVQCLSVLTRHAVGCASQLLCLLFLGLNVSVSLALQPDCSGVRAT